MASHYSTYLPAIKRMTEIVEKQKDSLLIEDLRALHAAKNWVREREENKAAVSAAQVKDKDVRRRINA